jgi:serine/alanine adding enzyme
MSREHSDPDITDIQWDNFVYSHPMGNIFQTMTLYRVYQKTKKYCPVKVAVIDKDSQEIQGVMTGVIIREMNGILGDFSARSVIQGGPLITSSSKNDVIFELFNEYDSLVSHAALYNEIRSIYDMQTAFNQLDKFTYVDHLNFLINLNQSDDNLWDQIHKSRRKNINRAEKAGVFIEEMEKPDKIPIFYKLLVETYNNVKVPLVDVSLFEAAFQHLVLIGQAKFFLARHDEDYIGARAVLLYKDRIYDWYAGAAVESLSFYPNECLVWHILKWGIKNNYSVFDFGGAGEPNKPYGPREFKRRFGGELVNYGRNCRKYSPVKMKVAEIGFKIYRKLFL